MTVIIDGSNGVNIASTTGTINLLGSTSGAITLAANAVAGTNTITLPAQTGNAAVDGPAFRVYVSNSQTIATNSQTTVQFTTKTFDTANCYSTSTYRFTPNVAGYYQFNFNVAYDSNAVGDNKGFIYKNGAKDTVLYELVTTSNFYTLSGSGLAYANGTTDYFEIQIYQNQGSGRALNSFTIWSGFLARAA
jgi:hypothetical protein